MFKFTCKQNQQNEVIEALKEMDLNPYFQDSVVFADPGKYSKRQIDKFLHKKKIKGSRSRRNRLPIHKIKNDELWRIPYMDLPKKFILSYMGRLYKFTWSYKSLCGCCGPVLRYSGIRRGIAEISQ